MIMCIRITADSFSILDHCIARAQLQISYLSYGHCSTELKLALVVACEKKRVTPVLQRELSFRTNRKNIPD